ncbi:hypothetical protein ALO50_200078 [Pseudomonas syringae pv. cerasicola]|uniref:Relaxase n=1 Tax=Pseudomonas syringae pv. cerasicola TaxID=264451 RepID=A0A0N8R6C8_PSESX|nr:hypothetical protein ALO50_200078 [Pseudomonas syringae pv. cerasicola]
MHAGEIHHVQTVADNRQTLLALHVQQTRENTVVARASDEARPQCDHFQTELFGTKDLLLGQVFGRRIVIMETLGHLLFLDAAVRFAIKVDRGRRKMNQPSHPLFKAALDDVFGKLHVALHEILAASPQADGACAVHHRFHVIAQRPHQIRVSEVALDELGATPDQVLDTFGTTAIDPHAHALLKGKTRKASADEAARAGDQNLHLPLR